LSRFRRRPSGPEWLALGDASRLLGVTPGTLRRWSDDGRVDAFTTPGGHRRYRRATLERLLPSERIVRPSLARSGMTPSRLARAYRRQAHAVASELPWLVNLSDAQRNWFRLHGRQLAQALLAHLDATAEAVADRHLAAATAEAAEYGRVAARLPVTLSDAVEGFLRFRRPFLHELALVAGRRGLDAGSTSALNDAAERVMDRLLIAAMTAHSIEQGARRWRGTEVETEELA
jgi:excisionase family DNA binding protein